MKGKRLMGFRKTSNLDGPGEEAALEVSCGGREVREI
jgi:hypothetical protein